ncbi:MAG: response regulator [bacterium]|nr:response regulator [bacterium]
MHVAVIDDQDASLAGFTQILRRIADIEPICFKKAAEALHWLGGVDPVFLVLNSTVADMAGIDFLRRMRVMPGRETTPVIFTTASRDDRDLRRTAFDLNVYAYLEKPINPSEFLVHAMRIVDAARERADLHARLREAGSRGTIEQAPTTTAPEPPPTQPAQAVPPARAATRSPLAEATAIIDAMLQVAALHDRTIIEHHELAAKIAVALGRELKLTPDELAMLGQAARIYDIGKVTIPQRILEARAPASSADRVTIDTHPDAGARVLAGTENPVLRAAKMIAQTHHERFDGSGYPRKLRGSSIPIMGRIVAVADALTALVRARSDRPAHSLAQAMDIVEKGAGTAYDPTVVAAVRGGLSEISRVVHEAQQGDERAS